MLIMPVLQFEAVFHYMKKLMERFWKSKDVTISPNDFIGERSEPPSDKLGGEICIATRVLVCIYLYIYICVRA